MATTDSEGLEAQQRFERALLESAHSDGLSAEAMGLAWARFSGFMAAAVASGSVPVVSVPSASGSARVTRLAAAKYLLLAALSGSALTFAWVGALRKGIEPQSVTASSARALTAPAVVPRVGLDSSSSDAAVQLTAQQLTASLPQLSGGSAAGAPRHAKPRLSKRAPAPAASSEPERRAAPSTLAAEVAALDAARVASRAGANHRALSLLEQYRSDFPDGALRADVDVLTIEALYAEGERSEALRRAAQFLVQFPNDPHSTMIQRLVANESTSRVPSEQ
jgi:hypothetical protein